MNIMNTKSASFVIVLLFTTLLLFRQSGSDVEVHKLPENAVVLAFGDSLTYGYGAVDAAYPLQLQKRIGRVVINAGVSGEVSSTGLKRLPKLLQRYHPALVILCHGGNDILRKQSKTRLKDNLKKMISLARQSGAQVLLVGVPGFGLLGLSTLPLYGEVADEEGVLYEGEILEQIENDPALKSDRIHPNAKGYGLMAETFARLLKEKGML